MNSKRDSNGTSEGYGDSFIVESSSEFKPPAKGFDVLAERRGGDSSVGGSVGVAPEAGGVIPEAGFDPMATQPLFSFSLRRLQQG